MQLVAAADGDLGDVGGEVIGYALRILADAAALVRAHGVEVAQQYHGPVGVGGGHVHQNLLVHELGPAVGAGAPARELLGYRHGLGAAVDGGGGGEDDLLHAVLLHQAAQHQRGVEVVVVVLQRLLGGFANGLVTGKVDYGVDIMPGKYLVQRLLVAAIHLVGGEVLAGDLAHALERFGFAVVIIVYDHDVIACVKQLNAGMRADITGAAGNKYAHQ